MTATVTPVIALDVDECLFAFLDHYAEWRSGEGLVSFRVSDMAGYGVSALLGQSRDEAWADEGRFLREASPGLPAMTGAVAAVAQLAEVAELHIVTARISELAGEATREWLDATFGDVFAGVHLKSLEDLTRTKGEICAEIGADVLVDDSPANLATLSATRGLLLGSWPWTASVTGPWVHAADWDEALPHLTGSH